jgi:predicted dinucleotide-binding enzyme
MHALGFELISHDEANEGRTDVSNPIERRDGAEIVKWDDHGGAGLAAHRQGELVGVPIAGDDAHAIDIASSPIREIGFDPVVIGGTSDGQISGSRNAARRRAYGSRNPAGRNEPPLSGRQR